HGKTSLVRAMTGVDTDRLPEERRRGMTIELGFAGLTIDKTTFGIVDVPGHERFVRTMVAGATGIDVALIVVAADDSVMPQTVEHVEVLNLLGVTSAVVALTKIDMVDEEMVDLVTDDIRRLLEPSPLRTAPICPVSSTTGAGLDALKRAIAGAAEGFERPPTRNPFRMAIDRVFSVQGRGTVVTGSVLRGGVSEGDTLAVWPAEATCRVRGLQSHGAASGSLVRGQRAAINVSGIDRDRLGRGSELATPGYLRPARMIDVRLYHLASGERPLATGTVVRLEMGSAETRVRVTLWESRTLPPGRSAFARLRSGEPITAAYGQRFILRDQNATRTLGGGVVLRPLVQGKRRNAAVESERLKTLETGDKIDRVEEVLRAARFEKPTDLTLCAHAGVELDELPDILDALRDQGRWVPLGDTDVCAVPAAVDDLAGRLGHWLERHHRKHPELPGRPADSVIGYLERITGRTVARALFDRFIETGTIKRLGRFVCSPAFAPSLSAADEKLLGAMIEEIRAGGFQPPSLDNLNVASKANKKRRSRLATLAVATGELVPVNGSLYLHADSERRLRDEVTSMIKRQGGVTVAEVREALGSSRKFVVPFMEYLDRVGFTKRVGDRRVLAE
ncbi:MAG: selenocysteine-specific translation elongation factor, partial [Phycisphaerae bacterium]